MKSLTFKLCTALVLSVLCVTNTGCELFTWMQKTLERWYPNESKVEVVVLPIFPECSDEQLEGALNFSFETHDSLKDGFDQFNKESDHIDLIWKEYRQYDAVLDCYRKIFKGIREDEDLNTINRTILNDIRDKNPDSDSLNCMIYGIFRYSPVQTAHYVTLVYYDLNVDNTATTEGVVTATPGSRAQKEAIMSLIKDLLQKVYD